MIAIVRISYKISYTQDDAGNIVCKIKRGVDLVGYGSGESKAVALQGAMQKMKRYLGIRDGERMMKC